MNYVKFLLSISIGILVYVLVATFAGPDGIWAYNQLSEQKNVLSTNVEKVQKINDTLILDHRALENDVGIITSKARNLGFIYEGEKLVKISGISTVVPQKEINIYDEVQYYENSVKKIDRMRKMVGFHKRRVIDKTTTAADLAYDAALNLIENMKFLSIENV